MNEWTAVSNDAKATDTRGRCERPKPERRNDVNDVNDLLERQACQNKSHRPAKRMNTTRSTSWASLIPSTTRRRTKRQIRLRPNIEAVGALIQGSWLPIPGKNQHTFILSYRVNGGVPKRHLIHIRSIAKNIATLIATRSKIRHSVPLVLIYIQISKIYIYIYILIAAGIFYACWHDIIIASESVLWLSPLAALESYLSPPTLKWFERRV